MRIAVFGTGTAGQTIASRLVELGHHVMMGSRSATNEKALVWAKKVGGDAKVGTFTEAAKYAEVIVNATLGAATLEVFRLAGSEFTAGKPVLDVSNPLDFTKGFPPTLFISNTDSLAETLQRENPNTPIVKALSTMNATLMVNPRLLTESSNTFVAANDAGAKAIVVKLLAEFGWTPDEIIDCGDLTAARAIESVLPIWLRLYGALKTPTFNLKVVR